MCKPSVDSIIEELGRKTRTLETRWNLLVKFQNYDRPNFEELKNMGRRASFPTIKLAYQDLENVNGIEPFMGKIELFLKADKEINLDEFVNTLYKLNGLNKFVSYNCIYRKTLEELKKVFILECRNQKIPFHNILNEIIENILSEIKTYEFYKALQGIELENTTCLPIYDVELFKFINSDERIELTEYEVNFVEDNFKDKVCVRYKATGEYRYSNQIAMKKFKAVIDCLRFLICMYYGAYLHKNQMKINLAEQLLDKSSTAFALNFDDKSFIFSRKMPDAFEDFKLSKEMYDELVTNIFFADIQRIMLSENKNSEWENLIANAIYWCSEAQNEYNIDIAFFKFWTAIETLVSSRGEKVTENVLNGATILYIYGIFNHKDFDFKKVKSALKKSYDKRSHIVHNGTNSAIGSSDLTAICNYAVTIILNSIFWAIRGYKKKERVKKYIVQLSKKHRLVKFDDFVKKSRFRKRHNNSNANYCSRLMRKRLKVR